MKKNLFHIKTNKKLVFYPLKDAILKEVPFYKESVPAGFPSPAEDFMDLDLNLQEYLVQHPSATFCVRAIGDSMVKAGIHSGDVMVVDRALEPRNKNIVLAVLNGEFTVKQLSIINSTFFLLPKNSKYSPVKISDDMDFEVWGIVSSSIRKHR